MINHCIQKMILSRDQSSADNFIYSILGNANLKINDW